MRLICSQKDLAFALSITNKAVSPNNTLPVLNNVLLKAEGKKLYFTATNLEIAISHHIECIIKNEGAITIPSRLFTSYINYLKDEKVDLSIEEGNVVLIKNSDSTTRIKGIPASEFPPIPDLEKSASTTLDASALKKAIKQVVFSSSLNTTRPLLAGVYVYTNPKGQLVFVATDSYRLAEKTITPEKTNDPFHCVVPARTFIEVGSILEGPTKVKQVELVVSKNQILFTIGEIRVISRLIEGQFPNYQQIIPKQTKTKVLFQRSELDSALKRINIFARENNNKVIFQIKNDGVILTTDSTQYGEGEIHLSVKPEGAATAIALNSQYILDVLNNVEGQEFAFEFGEKTSPVLLKSVSSPDTIHIIMPLKI